MSGPTTNLSRPLKVAIGALTLWPLLYLGLFFVFVFAMIVTQFGTASHRAGMPVAVIVVFALHFATILLTLGLVTFYIVFLFKTDRVPQDKKALWAAVLFLGGMIAMPVFFWLYVWPDVPKSKAMEPGSRAGA